MVAWVLLKTERDVADAAAKLAESKRIAFDVETTGVDANVDKTLLYIFKGETGDPYLAHWDVDISPIIDVMRTRVIIAHNAVFEYMFVRTSLGVPQLAMPPHWFCTLLAEKLLTNGNDLADRSLGGVAKKYLGVTLDKSLQTSWVGMKRESFSPTDEQYAYACGDVLHLHDIMQAQLHFLQREGLLRVARLEMAVLASFGEMRLRGFYLNVKLHSEVVERYREREAEARAALETALAPLWSSYAAREAANRAEHYARESARLNAYMEAQGLKRLAKDTPAHVRARVVELRRERDRWKPKKEAAINIASSEQVLAAFAEAGLEPCAVDMFGNKKPSLDKNVLREHLSHPLAALYAAWAKPNKVLTTYGESLRQLVNPVTNRVHSEYNQMVQSGRTSSLNPNQQNEPPDVRACFEAAPGYVLIVADAANQEGRLAAALSGDQNLLAVFLNGEDWHQRTAALAYPEKFASWRDVPKDSEERKGCKNANFSSIYGGTEYTLYQRGYVPSLTIGKRLMQAVYSFAPRLRSWSEQVANDACTLGYVSTISGRKRYFRLPDEPENPHSMAHKGWRAQRGSVRRAAMNHPVQGSGADVMKQAMVLLHQPIAELGGFPVAMVHDELVYEVPSEHAEEAAALVGLMMERGAACFVRQLPIPAEVHIRHEWKK